MSTVYLYASGTDSSSHGLFHSELWHTLTRNGASHLVPGGEYGGFYYDPCVERSKKKASIRRPEFVALMRRASPGDWLATYSMNALGWLSGYDYVRFVRMAMRFDIGIVSVRERWVVSPGSTEARAIEDQYQILSQVLRKIASRRRKDKLADKLAGRSNGDTQIAKDSLWTAEDFGAMEVVRRLLALGVKPKQISSFLLDLGYRRDAFAPHHESVARLIREIDAPRNEKRSEAFVLDGMTKSEVNLFEAAANAARQPVELWAIEALSKAAHRRLKKQQERERKLLAVAARPSWRELMDGTATLDPCDLDKTAS